MFEAVAVPATAKRSPQKREFPSIVCHCFAEAVWEVFPGVNTAPAKQCHTFHLDFYFFDGLLYGALTPDPSSPMGRRALRKIDPSLDLSEHLKTFGELPCPWDAEALFGRSAPLEVEVGSGKGLFLRTAAAERPEVDFLGIEISAKYARFAAAALAKRQLGNAKVVVTDALRVFGELLGDDSLAAVYVYFPDPWWKKRHEKRRLMQEPFVREVQRTLISGGILHFRTDVEQYYDRSVELLARHTHLEGPLDVPQTPAEHDMAYRTHFERRVRMHDEPVYRAEFRKP